MSSRHICVGLCLLFCLFSFGHCVVCLSSIYGFRLPLWNFQTLLVYLSEARTLVTNTIYWEVVDIDEIAGSPSMFQGSSWSWSHGSSIYNCLCNQCLSLQTLWVRIPLRRCVLDTTLCDKVCQWLAASMWFSPGNPVSSTNVYTMKYCWKWR